MRDRVVVRVDRRRDVELGVGVVVRWFADGGFVVDTFDLPSVVNRRATGFSWGGFGG